MCKNSLRIIPGLLLIAFLFMLTPGAALAVGTPGAIGGGGSVNGAPEAGGSSGSVAGSPQAGGNAGSVSGSPQGGGGTGSVAHPKRRRRWDNTETRSSPEWQRRTSVRLTKGYRATIAYVRKCVSGCWSCRRPQSLLWCHL